MRAGAVLVWADLRGVVAGVSAEEDEGCGGDAYEGVDVAETVLYVGLVSIVTTYESIETGAYTRGIEDVQAAIGEVVHGIVAADLEREVFQLNYFVAANKNKCVFFFIWGKDAYCKSASTRPASGVLGYVLRSAPGPTTRSVLAGNLLKSPDSREI